MSEEVYSTGMGRVSTTKQGQEGESLGKQIERIEMISQSLNAKVANIFSGAYSGAKSVRDDIDEIIEYIKNSEKNIKYFIFTDIDRLTRGGSKPYQEIKEKFSKIGVQMVDVNGIIQPEVDTFEYLGLNKKFEWAIESSSAVAENLKADFANDDRKKILRRLISREVELVREGFHIGPPLDGFKNKKITLPDGKKKVIQSPDDLRDFYYMDIFNLRALGVYSDKQIIDKVNANGFLTKQKNIWGKNKNGEPIIIGRTKGNPLTVKQLQKIVIRTEYCGIKTHSWLKKPIKAQYPGLVSIETFNKANRGKVFIQELDNDEVKVLYDYKPVKIVNTRQKYNPLYPYKGIIKCPKCKEDLKGSASTSKSGKKHPAYHCTRGHERFSLNKKNFENKVESNIKKLNFKKENIKILKSNLKKVFQKRKSEVVDDNNKIEENVRELRLEQEQIINSLPTTESLVAKKKLGEKIDSLEERIIEAEKNKKNVKIGENDLYSFLKFAEKLVEHLPDLLINTEDIMQKQALFRLVFEEPPTYDEIISGTPNLTEIFQVLGEKDLVVARRGVEPLFHG